MYLQFKSVLSFNTVILQTEAISLSKVAKVASHHLLAGEMFTYSVVISGTNLSHLEAALFIVDNKFLISLYK